MLKRRTYESTPKGESSTSTVAHHFDNLSIYRPGTKIVFGSNSLNLNLRNVGSVKEQQGYLWLRHTTLTFLLNFYFLSNSLNLNLTQVIHAVPNRANEIPTVIQISD